MLGTALVLGTFGRVADRRRTWWWFLVPAIVIGAPLTWAIRPQQNSVRWMIGWMAQDSGQLWVWFWLRNVGLLLPLFVVISLFGEIQPRLRLLTNPLWLWSPGAEPGCIPPVRMEQHQVLPVLAVRRLRGDGDAVGDGVVPVEHQVGDDITDSHRSVRSCACWS